MKRVLTAVVLIPLVLLLVFKGPPWALLATAWLVALLATREYLTILSHYGFEPFRAIIYVFLTLIFGFAVYASRLSGFLHPSGTEVYFPLLLLAFAVLLSRAMFLPELNKALPSAVLAGFALVYVGFPLLLLGELVMPSDAVFGPPGSFYIAALFLIVWAGDIVAYVVGRSIGKHLLAPRISPKKTWEGAVGSFLGALIVGFGVWFYGYRLGWLDFKVPQLHYWILTAAFVNVAAQVGDLVESLMKRGAGIKDSGSILPGHGGMLDRIDALLFAAPAMWYFPRIYWFFLNLIF